MQSCCKKLGVSIVSTLLESTQTNIPFQTINQLVREMLKMDKELNNSISSANFYESKQIFTSLLSKGKGWREANSKPTTQVDIEKVIMLMNPFLPSELQFAETKEVRSMSPEVRSLVRIDLLSCFFSAILNVEKIKLAAF